MRDIDSHPMSESVEKLIKVGAQSMISNIEEKKEYRDGVAQLMENYNRIENKGVLLVQPYYHFCCQVSLSLSATPFLRVCLVLQLQERQLFLI